MESLLGAMSGIGILLAIGYLVLTVFLIVYFFRMANDMRELKNSLDTIKKIMIKKEWFGTAKVEEGKEETKD